MKTNYLDAPQRYPPYNKDPMMELVLTPIPAWKLTYAKRAALALVAGAGAVIARSRL